MEKQLGLIVKGKNKLKKKRRWKMEVKEAHDKKGEVTDNHKKTWV